MAAIITNKFRLHNAEQFHESFSEAVATTYYLWIGRPQAFSTATGGGTDSAPPTPADTVGDEYRYFRDMIGAKKVTSSDVSFVVPRRDWTSGTVYDPYNHDYTATNTAPGGATNLWDSSFYVMNSNYRVYKCMDNNGGGTVNDEPDAPTTSGEFSTTDDYVWKYMFTMTTNMVQNFLSTDFMPVSATATDASSVATSAVDGEIKHVQIKNGGSGYNDGTWPAGGAGVDIYGDGSAGKYEVTVSSGIITNVNIVAAGTGYTFANLYLTGITGLGASGASVDAVLAPIITPKGGHGKDPVKELGGFYVMMNTSIAGAEGSGDFVVDQDFRRVGLIRDPKNSVGNPLTDTTASGLKTLTFTGAVSGTFQVDEEITNSASPQAKGIVASWDASAKILKIIQTEYTGVDTTGNLAVFADADTVTGGTSTASGTIGTGGIGNAEIQYHSGDIIYVENRAPIIRASDQTENIKLVIEF